MLTSGVSSLLPKSQSEYLDDLVNNKKDTVDAEYIEIEEKQEEITRPIINKKIGDAIQVAANEDLLNISDDKWRELLGYKTIEQVQDLRKELGDYASYLSIAVIIHNIICKIVKFSTNM